MLLTSSVSRNLGMLRSALKMMTGTTYPATRRPIEAPSVLSR